MWRRCVFTLFDSQPLAEAIAILAGEEGFSVIKGESFSPDIVALWGFALVVDRTLVTEDVYDIYLEVVGAPGGDEATRDKSAIIVVDSLRTLEYPPLDVVVQIDLRCPYAIRWILHTLDMAAKYIARMEE